MFGMLGVFAEFERAMIQERVRAGLERARKAGKILGRPKVEVDQEQLQEALRGGLSVRKVAALLGITPSKVQRMLRERMASGSSGVIAPVASAEVVSG
jgi:DNA invertase Pin-like site-specific DNA recombinase